MAFRNLPEMPCGPILELHGQRKRFHVPYGLKRLIEDMTREVLRYQPQNIYEFLAVFMESRLQKRLNEEEKNQKRKSWQQHRWSWQGASVLEPNELKEFLDQLPAPEEEVNHHAIVIQAAFRGYQARKMVKEIRKSVQIDDAQGKSQLAGLGEGKRSGDKGKTSQDENDNKTGANTQRRNTLDLTPVNATEEEIHSAVIIQAAWRGAHARNAVKNLRASLPGSSGKKSDGQVQVQKRGSTEDTQTQKQGNTDQAQGKESEATMANAQESDAGMNKENETGASGENGQDKQGTETVGGGQPAEESSNANVSQQQQESSAQPTGENAETPATENQGQTDGQKTNEGEQKPEEEAKPS